MAPTDFDSLEMLAAPMGYTAIVWLLFSWKWIPAVIVLAAAAPFVHRRRMSHTALMAGLLTGISVFPFFLLLAFLGAVVGAGGGWRNMDSWSCANP